MEINMLESLEFYKEIIENHPQPILVINSDNGEIAYVNQSAVDFYGYNFDDFVHLNINQINTYSDAEIKNEMELAIKEKRNYSVYRHKLANDSIKAVSVMSYPLEIRRTKVLLNIVQEMKNFNKKLNDQFYKAIEDVHDMICLIRIEPSGYLRSIVASKAFVNLIEKDVSDVEDVEIESFLRLKNGYSYDDAVFDAEAFNAIFNKSVSVRVTNMQLRFYGDKYYLMKFEPLNVHPFSTRKLSWSDIEEHKSEDKGVLIDINYTLNNNNQLLFEKVNQVIRKKIESLFEEQHIMCERMSVTYRLTYFCHADTNVLYELAEKLIADQDKNQELLDIDIKYRVSISDYSYFGEKQLLTLNEMIKSYDDYEFDNIHAFAESDQFIKAIDIKNSISKAIETDQMRLYIQGIVDVKENCVEGYEVLIRWQHPDYGLVYPNEFLHLLELTGEVVQLDFWVIKRTFEFLRNSGGDFEGVYMHINLSPKTLANRDLLSYIKEHVHGVNVHKVVFEVTEEKNTPFMQYVLTELKQMGFLLAIDDFGKGYSSFSRIKNFGVQYVKIDKSFIHGLTENVDDLLILKSIISMCNNLNIKVIAEGIESLEQLEFLYSRKCYIIQGFLFSKPDSIVDLELKHQKTTNHAQNIINHLASKEITTKKFYNRGRIIFQDIDLNYEFVAPNIELSEMLNFDLHEFMKKSFLDLLPKKYMQPFKTFTESLCEQRDLNAIMLNLLGKGETTYRVICAANKKVEQDGYRLFLEFLEHEKETESELLGLSHSYIQAFEEAPSGMMIIDDDYCIKKWNRSCELIFGRTFNDVKDKNAIKLLADEENSRSMNSMLREAVQDTYSERLIDNSNADKELICRWHVSAIFDDTQQTHQYICIINDITEDLRNSRKMSRVNMALNQSNSIIIMTDVHGVIEYVNDEFYKITGFDREAVIGTYSKSLSMNEQNREYYSEIWRTIMRGEVWSGEVLNMKKDQTSYWAKVSIYPINEDSEVTGFVEIQTDTTNERELMDMNQNLKTKLFEQDKVASLGLLSSGIMHEINNPLSYIQGNVKYIIEEFSDLKSLDDDEIEDLKDAILDIDKGVTQIKDIAEGLKKYIFNSNLDEKEEVDLVSEIETVLMLSKNEYKYYASIDFLYDEDENYVVLGFASKLKQVFMNIIINAAHAISGADKGDLGNIKIELGLDDLYLNVMISDNGTGMDAATVEKIFEPLFTTKEEGVGSGLGLSVSRQIIEEDHDGKLSCVSILGEGTKFTIQLPKGLNGL